jgi:tRNA1(Val) A37 N6-methylase TrmN6
MPDDLVHRPKQPEFVQMDSAPAREGSECVSDRDQRHAGIETTDDAFLGGQLTIEQAVHGSRAGMDAVFLAAACPVKSGERVLEAGSGSGVVALAIARRVGEVAVSGIEIDAAMCELARRNAARNGLIADAEFFHGDVTAPLSQLFALGLAPDSFDHAVANPPFLETGQARLPPEPSLSRAHAAASGDLEGWIKCLAAFVKPRGTVTIVHRADAVPRLLVALNGRFGALTLFPLFPREGAPAVRILIQGRKASRARLRMMPGMVLHGAGNAFTPAAQAILRDVAALELHPPQ